MVLEENVKPVFCGMMVRARLAREDGTALA